MTATKSSEIIRFKPGIKTRILAFLIPVVVCVGLAMIALDRLDVANVKEQNASKAGVLLIVYCLFSLRGLFIYRVFLELTPTELIWRQGFQPFQKRFSIPYSDIERMEISALTSTLVMHLKSGKQLKLAPSFRRTEGELAEVSSEEIGTRNVAVREIFYLKHELEERAQLQRK